MPQRSTEITADRKNLLGRFFVLAAVFSLAGAIVLSESFRVLRSEVTVFVTTRGPETGNAIETLIEMTKTEQFLNRLLDRSPDATEILADVLPGTGAEGRRTLAGAVTFTRLGTSDLVRIEARGDIPDDTRVLARESAKAFFELSGTLYGEGNELSVRAVDGPVTTVGIVAPFWYTVASIAFGMALSALVLAVVGGVRSLSRLTWPETRVPSPKPRPFVNPVVTKRHITRDVFVPRRPTEIFSLPSEDVPTMEEERLAVPVSKPKEDWYDKIAPIIEAPEMPEPRPLAESKPVSAPAVVERSAFAPANLPAVDLSALGLEFAAEEPEEQRAEKISDIMETAPAPAPKEFTPVVSVREPSVEEYRRRLNELLSSGR